MNITAYSVIIFFHSCLIREIKIVKILFTRFRTVYGYFRYKSITDYTEVTRYITLLQGKVILLRNALLIKSKYLLHITSYR